MRRTILVLGVLVVALTPSAIAAAQHGRPAACPHPNTNVDTVSAADSLARAIRCAEWFIAQQGFTEQPVIDTAGIVSDFEERALPRATVLTLRRGSLAPHAYGVCTALPYQSGYVVVFVSPRTTPADSVGQTVWMSRAFQDMHVTHQGIYLAPVRAGEFGCRLLPSSAVRRQQN